MNKIKIALIALAVLLAVGGAYATRPRLGCESSPQYHFTGSGYVAAGRLGVDYTCMAGGGICTYYKPDPINEPNTFAACKTGIWTPIP